MIEAAHAIAERSLTPMTREQFAIGVDRLLAWGVAFNVTIPDIKETTKIYAQTLAAMPGDLFLRAVDAAIKTWRWGNRLPMPADLTAAVEAEWSERRAGHTQLGHARDRWNRDHDAREERFGWYRAWRGDYYAQHGRTPEEDGVKWPGPGHRYRRPSVGEPPPAVQPTRDQRGHISEHTAAVKNALSHLNQNLRSEPEVSADDDEPESPEKGRFVDFIEEKSAIGTNLNGTNDLSAVQKSGMFCHASAIALLSIFAGIAGFSTPVHAYEINGLYGSAIGCHRSAIGTGMAKHGILILRVRLERSALLTSTQPHNKNPYHGEGTRDCVAHPPPRGAPFQISVEPETIHGGAMPNPASPRTSGSG